MAFLWTVSHFEYILHAGIQICVILTLRRDCEVYSSCNLAFRVLKHPNCLHELCGTVIAAALAADHVYSISRGRSASQTIQYDNN